jgi:hypothetical protein
MEVPQEIQNFKPILTKRIEFGSNTFLFEDWPSSIKGPKTCHYDNIHNLPS